MLTKADLGQIDRLLEKRIDQSLRKRVDLIKQDVSRIRGDMKTVVNFFDHKHLDLRKRVEKIEEHLRLTTVA